MYGRRTNHKKYKSKNKAVFITHVQGFNGLTDKF